MRRGGATTTKAVSPAMMMYLRMVFCRREPPHRVAQAGPRTSCASSMMGRRNGTKTSVTHSKRRRLGVSVRGFVYSISSVRSPMASPLCERPLLSCVWPGDSFPDDPCRLL